MGKKPVGTLQVSVGGIRQDAAAHRDRQASVLAPAHSAHPADAPIEVLNPAGWPRATGYSHGIATRGRVVFVAGQVGWDARQVFHSGDLIEQIRQALRNIVVILAEAGAQPCHIARMTWYITDRHEYNARLDEIGEVYREVIGRHYPAMTAVQVAGLIEHGAKVEIEATAVVPD